METWCEFDASLTCSNACEFSSISSNDVTGIRDYLWLPNRQLNLEYDNGHNIFTERYPPYHIIKPHIKCEVLTYIWSCLRMYTFWAGMWVWVFVWVWVGYGGGCTSRGGCEMPRPCLKDVEQAQGNPRFSKSSLTCDHQWWSILC